MQERTPEIDINITQLKTGQEERSHQIPVFLPYTDTILAQQEALAKRLGVLVLLPGETEEEYAIKTLRGMSNTLEKRGWDPQPIGSSKFVIKLPNDNALDYLISRRAWPCKEDRTFFRSTDGQGKKA